MDPFKDFGHFIAYFIPGVISFVLLLLALSIISGSDLLSGNIFTTYIFITLICSSILGLFIDEFRHTFLEEHLEKRWADKSENNVDLNKLGDPVSHAPKLGVDVYKLIRDEYFYFYEFDINVAIVFLISSLVAPFYLFYFHLIKACFAVLAIGAVLLIISILFCYFGVESYDYYETALLETVKKVDPNFKPHKGDK
jgi:hypothetical protein